MAAGRRSRYYGLETFIDGDRLAVAQRLIVQRRAEEPFVLHQLTDTETLDQLAQKYYGSDDLWWRIADANPMRFPLDWKPGDVIRIPAGRTATRVAKG